MADMEQAMPAEAATQEAPAAVEGEAKPSVTIAATEAGAYSVTDNATGKGRDAPDIEQALAIAQEILTADDGGMSVQQAFEGGFKEAQGAPSMGY
jgi:hypothetical protein